MRSCLLLNTEQNTLSFTSRLFFATEPKVTMAQYQSFPDTTGSSKSLDKLKALRLPPMQGLSFLDIGCNEGFFCGFAKYEGASRVLGLDRNKTSIEHAKARFPGVEFRCQSWDEPINEKFDVILLASALHYAKDQEALVQKLLGLLTPTGTLVLELGMAPDSGNKWVTVKRSIDERQFPTRGKIAAMLDTHAWKIIGHSVDQAGDPLSRVVVHIQNKRPYAFLLMERSGYGKTSITRLLSTAKGISQVSGDTILRQIWAGEVACSDELRQPIERDYASTNIAPLTESLFQSGLGTQLVDVWLEAAEGSDVIIDSFVPKDFWPSVTQRIQERRFVPIQLTWDLMGPKLHGVAFYNKLAEGYLNELAEQYPSKSKSSLLGRLINKLTPKSKKQGAQHIDKTLLPKDFDPQVYLRLHPDVRSAGIDPVTHYIKHGISERRRYKS